MPPFIFSIYSIAKFLGKVKFMGVKYIENNLLIGNCKEELIMSYTKQTWATGDVITANKMNHIEDGIADSDSGSAQILFIDLDSLDMAIDENGDTTNYYEYDLSELKQYLTSGFIFGETQVDIYSYAPAISWVDTTIPDTDIEIISFIVFGNVVYDFVDTGTIIPVEEQEQVQ